MVTMAAIFLADGELLSSAARAAGSAKAESKARTDLLKLQSPALPRFGCQKLDPRHSHPAAEFQVGLAGRRRDGLLILDAVATVLFVRWLFAVVVHEVQCDLVSKRRA